MRHTLLFLALLVCAASFSQIVNIPDPIFKQALINQTNPEVIDDNGDGEIQVSEAESTDIIFTNNLGISDPTGIEAFVNLKELYWQQYSFTDIDLSANTELEVIFITVGTLENITMPPASDNLKELSLFGNQLTDISFLSDYQNLEVIAVNFNQIETIDVTNNVLLRSLSIDGNPITSLDISSNSNLDILNVEKTDITMLDISNINLVQLGVGGNFSGENLFSNLNLTGQTNLERLYIGGNNDENLDLSANINLELLELNNVLYTTLDISVNTVLKELIIKNSDVSTVGTMSNSVLEIIEIDNILTTTLDLSQNILLKNVAISNTPINSLDVSNNILLEDLRLIFTEVPSLNLQNLSQLGFLDYYGGSLAQIIYPNDNNIAYLQLFYTNLESLDFSDFNSLCKLRLRYNPNLSELNLKNGNTELLVSGNPCYNGYSSGLSIRFNPNLNFVCVDDAAFAAANFEFVSPYITFTEDCTLNSNDLNQIQGLVSYDMDSNGCASGNLPLDGFIVSSSDGTNTFANGSNNGGNYNINLSENTYTTSMVGLPTYFEATPASVSDTFVGFNQVEQQDFCVQATTSANDLNVSINPQYAPVPGGTGLYSVVYQNAGTTELAASITMSFDNDKMTFNSAEPAPSSQTASSLTWDLGTLPVFTTDALEVRFDLEGALNIGTPLEFSASIEPIAGDATPEDNEFTMVDFVAPEPFVDGMDVPQGAEELIEDAGNYLNYVVNFENNTGSIVEDILINTILSDNLEVNSLQIINSSHPVTLQLYNNEVYFNLEGINLPEVENNGGGGNNTGYVMYRARPISSIALGDVVASSAIVFLDGSPRFTNTVQTRFVDVLDTPDFNTLEIGLYPNPTTGIFKVSASELIEIITVYTISGQQLKRVENIQKKETTLNIEALATGIYFAHVKTTQGEKVFRVLKQ